MTIPRRPSTLLLLVATIAISNTSCDEGKTGGAQPDAAKSADGSSKAEKTGAAVADAGTGTTAANGSGAVAAGGESDATSPDDKSPPARQDEVHGYRLLPELDGNLTQLLEEAVSLQKRGKYKAALDLLKRGVNMRGSSQKRAEALVELGDTLFRQGKDAQSEKLDPGEEADANVVLQQAADIFDAAVSRYPSEVDDAAFAAYMSGSSYLLLGDQRKAFDRYKLAYSAYPKSKQAPKALLRLGVTKAGLGDVRAARSYYSQFLQQHGADPKEKSSVSKVQRYLRELSIVGRPAPQLKASAWLRGALAGGLTDLRGEVVVLTFFMTGCGYCKNEMPKIRRDIAEWTDRGVVFLGISDPTNPEATTPIDAYLNEHRIDFFDVCIDRGGVNERPYQVRSYPAAVIVDRKGIIRWRGHYAFLSYTLLKQLVEE